MKFIHTKSLIAILMYYYAINPNHDRYKYQHKRIWTSTIIKCFIKYLCKQLLRIDHELVEIMYHK